MAKLKFRPLHDRVVVKRIEAEERSKGTVRGVILQNMQKLAGVPPEAFPPEIKF